MIFANKKGVSHSLGVWPKDKYSYMLRYAFRFYNTLQLLQKGYRKSTKIVYFARQKSLMCRLTGGTASALWRRPWVRYLTLREKIPCNSWDGSNGD